MKSLIKTFLLVFYSFLHPDRSRKVIFYHDIGLSYTPMGTPLELFKRHLAILAEYEACGTKHVICFDDGFRGLYDHKELVKSLGVKVFVAVDLVGKPGYLTWDEMRELQKNYGVDFQCHTWSHQTLVGEMIDESPIEDRAEGWYKRELEESRAKIAGELGTTVDELCFPVGLFSGELIDRCKAVGYRRVYASYPGNFSNDYLVPRCLVQDLSPCAFAAALNGGLMFFKNRYLALHKR